MSTEEIIKEATIASFIMQRVREENKALLLRVEQLEAQVKALEQNSLTNAVGKSYV